MTEIRSTIDDALSTDDTNLGSVLRRCAHERREDLALIVDNYPLTYGEWEERSARLASGLASIGVEKGARVVCILPNCVEQILVWFAATRLGAIWTPLNIAMVGDDLRGILENADPALIIVDDERARALEGIGGGAIKPPVFGVNVKGGPLGIRPFAEIANHTQAPAPVALAPSDPATILYSGGTTGKPKGIVVPHFSYVAGGYRYLEYWNPRPDDIHLTVMQLFHSGALNGAAIAPLFAGIVGVIEGKFSASNYWRRVAETGATLIDPLGTMLPYLSAQPPGPYDKNHKVRACWFATAHLPVEQRRTFEERFNVKLFPGTYASTECGGNYVVSARFGDPDHPDDWAIGKTWGWAELCIADDEDRPLPAGSVGNVLLRPTIANMFMKGYFADSERTQAAMANFWLHTGDLGRLDANGYFYFEGRAANWIRCRGENVSALEVETALSAHPEIQEIVAVGLPAEVGGEEEIKAFVILKGSSTATEADIHAWCLDRMTKFKIPRFIEFIDDFPRSVTKREVERAKLKVLPNDNAFDAHRQKQMPDQLNEC